MNNKIHKIIAYFIHFFSIKTILFNFKYFPLKKAVLLPVYVSGNTWLKCLKGTVEIKGKIFPGIIKIGYGDVGIFDRVKSRTIWQVKGIVSFDGRANIGHGSKICVYKKGYLEIGENFEITAESSIVCEKKIVFGKNCLLSWDILIMDSDFHKVYSTIGDIINYPKNIIIGDHVWIGCRVSINKGINIPSGCIVASGSIVKSNNFAENSIIAGIPAKESQKISYWTKENFSAF